MSRRAPRPDIGSEDVLEEAENLGIPWQVILSNEIHGEKALRDSVENLDGEWPLSCLFSLLPYSLLQSWRARDCRDGVQRRARHDCNFGAPRDPGSRYSLGPGA